MTHQRKLLAVITALLFASPSMAAFTSLSKVQVQMKGVLGGTPTVSFSIAIKDHNNVTGPDRSFIGWTNLDPSALGPNPWRIADQLVKINSTITDVNGGIQLVTDNTASDAKPRFIDPSPFISSNTDSNPGGLLLVPQSGNQTSQTVPVAWSIKSSSLTVGTQIGSSDPNTGVTTGESAANYRGQWLYVVDRQTPAIDWDGNGLLGDWQDSAAFVNGQKYSTLADARGIHYGNGEIDFGGGAGTKTSYLYLEANFSQALPLSTYAGRLTLEAFTE